MSKHEGPGCGCSSCREMYPAPEPCENCKRLERELAEARAKAEQYQIDWMAAKAEFGDKMAVLRQRCEMEERARQKAERMTIAALAEKQQAEAAMEAALRTCSTCEGTGVMSVLVAVHPPDEREEYADWQCAECGGHGLSIYGQMERDLTVLRAENSDLRALLDEARSHNPEKYRSSSDDSGTHGAETGGVPSPSPSSDWTRVAPSGEGSGQPAVRHGWCPHCGVTLIEDYSIENYAGGTITDMLAAIAGQQCETCRYQRKDDSCARLEKADYDDAHFRGSRNYHDCDDMGRTCGAWARREP